MATHVAGRSGKFLAAFLCYALLEVFAYKAVSLWLRVMPGSPFDYQDWAYLFYFPDKKVKFFYYLVFMVSTWAYFLVLNVYVNVRERHDVPAE